MFMTLYKGCEFRGDYPVKVISGDEKIHSMNPFKTVNLIEIRIE